MSDIRIRIGKEQSGKKYAIDKRQAVRAAVPGAQAPLRHHRTRDRVGITWRGGGPLYPQRIRRAPADPQENSVQKSKIHWFTELLNLHRHL
jgi:hypothetical protein